jgi:hypothetical protein
MEDMTSIRAHGADDVITTIRYTATCRYCGRLIECLNAEFLLGGKDIPDREAPEAIEHRMDWAHREGVGRYYVDCKPEEYTGEYDGMTGVERGSGKRAMPRVDKDGRYSAKWTIIVSVNGTDRFGVHTTGRDSAREWLSKILIWNTGG